MRHQSSSFDSQPPAVAGGLSTGAVITLYARHDGNRRESERFSAVVEHVHSGAPATVALVAKSHDMTTIERVVAILTDCVTYPPMYLRAEERTAPAHEIAPGHPPSVGSPAGPSDAGGTPEVEALATHALAAVAMKPLAPYGAEHAFVPMKTWRAESVADVEIEEYALRFTVELS